MDGIGLERLLVRHCISTPTLVALEAPEDHGQHT